MKRIVFLGLISLLLLPLIAVGCTAGATGKTDNNQSVPPLNGGEEAKTVEITLDDFAAEKHITKDITIVKPGSLIVTLGANPTTGYTWEENADLTGSAMKQVSHQFVEPADEGVVGAPGKDVGYSTPMEAGTATITFDYSRPWEAARR
jgi:inhibitor of cysteine peptidase